MSVREYKGARYVPIFGRVGEETIEWDNSKGYEPLTIVLHEGNSYTSRQYVPVGIDIANKNYWAETGNYNAQVEQYRQETAEALSLAKTNEHDIDLAEDRITEIEATHIYVYDTVANMLEDDNLTVSSICRTKGFYSPYDNGGSFYKIVSDGTPNSYDCFAINNLFAKLIYKPKMNIYQFGYNNTSVTLFLNYVLSLGIQIDFLNVTVTPESTLEINSNYLNIINGNFNLENCNTFINKAVYIETVKIVNCTFENGSALSITDTFPDNGALSINSKNVFIDNCIFKNNECHGLAIYDNGSNNYDIVSITNCTAYNNGFTNVSAVRGCGLCSYITPDRSAVNHCLIENCVSYNNGYSGIAFHGLNNILYSNCTSYNNYEHGFVFQDSSYCIISNCKSYGNSQRSLRIQGNLNNSNGYCDTVIAVNNIFNTWGVQIGHNVNSVLIANNAFDFSNRSSATSVVSFDVDFSDTVSNVVITNNTLVSVNNDNFLLPYRNFKNVSATDNFINGAKKYLSFSKNQGDKLFPLYTSSNYSLSPSSIVSPLTFKSFPGCSIENDILTITSTGVIARADNISINDYIANIGVFMKLSSNTNIDGSIVVVFRIRNSSEELLSESILAYNNNVLKNHIERFFSININDVKTSVSNAAFIEVALSTNISNISVNVDELSLIIN